MEGLVLLALLAVAGFAAQLVDGALGMGYGITSSTILLLIGLSPAAASASVHKLVRVLAQALHTTDSETSIGKLCEGLRFQEGLGHSSAPRSSQLFRQNHHGRFRASSYSCWGSTL
jgi:hypothetical protein